MPMPNKTENAMMPIPASKFPFFITLIPTHATNVGTKKDKIIYSNIFF